MAMTIKPSRSVLRAYFSAMGRKGGRAATEAKRAAAAANGRKGGRPRRAGAKENR